MADNRYKDFTDEAIKQLTRLEEKEKALQKKVDDRNKKNLSDQTKIHQKLLAQLDETKNEIDEINEREKQRLTYAKQLSKENVSYFRSISKITPETRKLLGFEKNITQSRGVFSSLSKDVIEMKAQEANLDDDELETSVYRRGILEEQLATQQSQASALVRAKKEENELSQFKEQQAYYDSLRSELGDEIVDKLIDSNRETENLFKQEQRLLTLKEEQKSLYDAMPESLKSAVSFGQGLIGTLKKAGAATVGFAILGAILVSAITAFTSLDSAAEKFNQETGLAVSQVKELRTQANNLVSDFRNIGLEAQDYYDIQKEIVGVLGDTARVSDSIAGAQAVITKNFGVSNQAAAKTLQIFQSLGGVSENTAASLQLQTLELAKQVGVAPAKVLEDIAESSDAIYGAFRGNSEELVKQAVQARRLGTNLKDVLETTDKLLDFESSITKELEASAFVGGQFNLSQARALRAAGDIAGAQEEILRQVQRSGDFRQQDVFTQRALAEAAGMTVDEIARQLTVQDRLNSLGVDQIDSAKELLDAGVDITNLNDTQLAQEVQKFALQKEQQGQLTNISNAFQGIAATLASTLVPLLESLTPILSLALAPIQLMAEGLASMVGFIREQKELFGAVATIAGIVYGIKYSNFLLDKGEIAYKKVLLMFGKKELAQEGAIAGVKALSNPARALAGLAAAALVIGAISKFKSKADDAMFSQVTPSGYGKRALLEEGSITLFNNKDTIIAGTNLNKGVDSMTPQITPEYVNPFENQPPLNEIVNEIKVVQPEVKPEYVSPFENQPPINKTVDEIKVVQTENTINDKLIRTIERLEQAYMKGAQVNLDGQKVIRGLGRVGNETTQNNFSLV